MLSLPQLIFGLIPWSLYGEKRTAIGLYRITHFPSVTFDLFWETLQVSHSKCDLKVEKPPDKVKSNRFFSFTN